LKTSDNRVLVSTALTANTEQGGARTLSMRIATQPLVTGQYLIAATARVANGTPRPSILYRVSLSTERDASVQAARGIVPSTSLEPVELRAVRGAIGLFSIRINPAFNPTPPKSKILSEVFRLLDDTVLREQVAYAVQARIVDPFIVRFLDPARSVAQVEAVLTVRPKALLDVTGIERPAASGDIFEFVDIRLARVPRASVDVSLQYEVTSLKQVTSVKNPTSSTAGLTIRNATGAPIVVQLIGSDADTAASLPPGGQFYYFSETELALSLDPGDYTVASWSACGSKEEHLTAPAGSSPVVLDYTCIR